MAAIDQTLRRHDAHFDRIEEELRAIRAELAAMHRTLVQGAFGVVGVLIAEIVALVIALA